MPITDFKKQIKILMTQKKINAGQLARMCDLNNATVYNYLNGDSQAAANNVELMINKLTEIKI